MGLQHADAFTWAWVPPLLVYCAASMLMTVTNKLVLSGYPYHRFVFFVLSIQSVMTVLFLEGLALVQRCRGSQHPSLFQRPSRTTLRAWFTVALGMASMLYTGAQALAMLPVGVFSVVKNFSLIAIAVGERWMGASTPVTPLMIVSFLLMAISSGLAVGADALAEGAHGATPLGYLWAGLNCTMTAVYVIHMRSRVRDLRLASLDTVYLNNYLTAPLFLLLTWWVDTDWTKFHEDAALGLAGTTSFIHAAMFSGFSAFFISFGTAWCMRVVNGTTYAMVGAMNKLPLSMAGILFLHEPATVGSIGAIVLGTFPLCRFFDQACLRI
jgi:GDP-mannose transporter